jgi:hypothetical protein
MSTTFIIFLFSFQNSLVYDRDTGHKNFLEDAFENESRVPGTAWQPGVPSWTDVVCCSILTHGFLDPVHMSPVTETFRLPTSSPSS